MYKAIATDMDGTLLNDDKRIPQLNKDAIAKIKDNTKVILASARGLYGLEKYLKELDLVGYDNQYTICFNGSYIINNKFEVIFDNYIDLKIARHLIIYLIVNCPELEVFIYNKNGIKSVRDIHNLDEYITSNHLYKIAARGNTDDIFKWRHNLPKEIYEYMEVTNSDAYSFECVKKGNTKCSGLKMLCELLDIKPSELICVGDGENDIEMIEYAGLGVAMKNGFDFVKEKADYITDYNNNGGVGKVINKFILGEEIDE